MLIEIKQIIDRVREQKPLVHHLTNYVTANDSANITLAIGASPVMADALDEVEEMAAQAGAVVLNIGTLHSLSVEAMLAAGRKATAGGIPVIFDPVGAGATRYRTAAAERIIREVRPAVIRGNLSEIKVLNGMAAGIRGVDSVADEGDAEITASRLAEKLDCVVAVTGKIDIIARPGEVCRLANGHPMLTSITGAGCMSSSLVGCCCAVADVFSGAIAGVAVMGIAGQLAQQALNPGEGTGMFRMRLFDAVSRINGETLERNIRLS